MNPSLEPFFKAKKIFEKDRSEEEGSKVMEKIITIVNYVGSNFSNIDGGELAEIQVKLAGYKFYLADYLKELNRRSEAAKIEIKNHRGRRWGAVTEDIKILDGKVKNKEQIENVINLETAEMANEQILFETMYYQYRLKLSALDDIITAVVQQIAQKKREFDLSQKN